MWKFLQFLFMPKIQYKPDVKILSIRLSDRKSVDSDIQGNAVLDYDRHGNLVNIDVLEINIEQLASIPKDKMMAR